MRANRLAIRWTAPAPLILGLLLLGCLPIGEPAPPTTTAPDPATPGGFLPAPSTRGATVTALPMATPTVLIEPTADYPPLPPVEPTSLVLEGTPVVDEARGRLFWSAVSGEARYIAVFDGGGELRALFAARGRLAYDPGHNWLLVDAGPEALTWLNATTGEPLGHLALPPTDPAWIGPGPVYDPETGGMLVARGQTLFQVDLAMGTARELVRLEEPISVCGETGQPSPIESLILAPDRHRLYVSMMTYVCTPWRSLTVLDLDLAQIEVAGRLADLPPFAATSCSGAICLKTYPRLGGHDLRRWDGERERVITAPFSDPGPESSGFVADAGHGVLYESTTDFIRVYDAATLEPLGQAFRPGPGRLVAYVPAGDQLVFLTRDGRPAWRPAGPVRSGLSAYNAPAPGPVLPGSLSVAPGWSETLFDRSLAALWALERCPPGTSLPYFGYSGGAAWLPVPVRPWSGTCEPINALLINPDPIQGPTLWAAFADRPGLHESVAPLDGWAPLSGNGLPDGPLVDVRASPTFGQTTPNGQDLSLFVRAQSDGQWFHSPDRGQNWHPLDETSALLVPSPDFGNDQTLFGVEGDQIWRRPLAGARVILGPAPGEESLALLGVSPGWSVNRRLYAYSQTGSLYISDDLGASWTVGLTDQPGLAQLVFAPVDQSPPPAYLLAPGGLYYAADSGSGWDYLGYRGGTALAISPRFSQDGALFVAAGDGQVVRMERRPDP